MSAANRILPFAMIYPVRRFFSFFRIGGPCFLYLGLLTHSQADVMMHGEARTLIRLSAQDHKGEVWAIDTSEKLLRWIDNGWRETADSSAWEGSLRHSYRQADSTGLFFLHADGLPPPAGPSALWPSAQDGVESLWEQVGATSATDPTSPKIARLFHTQTHAGFRASPLALPSRQRTRLDARHTPSRRCVDTLRESEGVNILEGIQHPNPAARRQTQR